MNLFSVRAAVLVLAAVFVCNLPQAATIRIELDFDQPVVTLHEDGVVWVTTPDCVTFNDPGMPLLPACPANVLLPPGEVVTSIRVLPEEVHTLEGTYLVPPAQKPQPISLPGPFPPTEPDAAVYGSDEHYPAVAARLVIEQKGWGHGLAFLQVRPVAYRPVSGELLWYDRVVVEVDTALGQGADPRIIPRLRRNQPVLDRLAGMVLNPQDLALYEGSESEPLSWSRLESDYYPYVIITSTFLAEYYEEVAEFQSSRGLRATVMTMDEIISEYGDGGDNIARIRQFIIDAYENWGTEYVLLGGDYQSVPGRMLYWSFEDETASIGAHCYYEGLDGTWDNDHDMLYGEPGEEDLVGEVAVGRAVVNSLYQFRNWSHKNEMYTEHPVESQIEKGLFVAELLNTNVWTWGGDAMDELINGSDACGYTTAGYPQEYDNVTLYDRDDVWDKFDLIDLINEGFPTIHHLGHTTYFFALNMYFQEIAYLTNDGVNSSYTLGYTQGCYAGACDLWGIDACFCGAMVGDDNGAAAFVCNNRNGYYNPGQTCGNSHYYHREFVDARYGEGIHTAGWMNVDSKTDLIWMLDEYNRYVHYELNLFGDPAIPQWGSLLGTLSMEHKGRYVPASGTYLVTVAADGAVVPGATVTMYSADFSVWASAVTNDSGIAQLHPGEVDAKTLYLKAVKSDYLVATDDLKVRRK